MVSCSTDANPAARGAKRNDAGWEEIPADPLWEKTRGSQMTPCIQVWVLKKKMPSAFQLDSSPGKVTLASSKCHSSVLLQGLLYSSVSHMY